MLSLALVYGIAFHELGHACVHAIEGNFKGFRVDGMIIKCVGVKGANLGAMYAGGLFLNFITFPVLFQMIPRDEWLLFVITFVVGSVYDIYKFVLHLFDRGGKP